MISDIQKKELDCRSMEYMSDGDLERYFPNNPDTHPIMKYSELADVTDIYNILPKDGTFKIILIESRQNVGHWTALCRTKDQIIYFDSYSNKPDGQLRYITSFWRKMLGQDDTYLTKLLKNVKDREVVWSNNRFQSLKKGTGTCGRWCLLFLNMVLNFGYTIDEFEQFINHNCKELGLSKDQLVTLWIK
tara:strand:+ start:685 stop:1251 length:567 start_codon:yes stop_codon:yes gene_type:complete